MKSQSPQQSLSIGGVIGLAVAVVGILALFFHFWFHKFNARGKVPIQVVTYNFENSDLNLMADDDIDLVYTWVDSSDPDWISMKQEIVGSQMETYRFPPHTHTDLEIHTSLVLSLHNIPWIRTLWIVTMRPHFPKCLFSDPLLNYHFSNGRIRLVHHETLGIHHVTFNSHAIEGVLHNIPNLSEKFLYMNDDMYIVKPLPPAAFFFKDKPVYRCKGVSRVKYIPCHSPHWCAWKMASMYFPWFICKNNHGVPWCLTRSIMQTAQDHLPEHWRSTIETPVRSSSDIATIGFALNLAIKNRQVVSYGTEDKLRSFSVNHSVLIERLDLMIDKVHTFCINSLEDPVEMEKVLALVQQKGLKTLNTPPYSFAKK